MANTQDNNPKKRMRLGAFFNPTGHHVASWRHAESQADAGINIAHYRELAQTAERAKFDMIFLADNVCVRKAHIDALSRSAQYIANFEPLTLLSALSGATNHIGLVATATTSYNEPYHVARKFASLDHISGGRAGWNLVTSGQQEEAQNFGRDAHYGHGERYERAREFAQIVTALWDSWDDDAFIRDKASGQFFNPQGLHTLDHKGKFFSVRGPLNVPRSPQGHPVIVQAGGSDDMINVAAEFAEVIFCAPLTIEAGKKLYGDLKAGDGQARPRSGPDEDHAGPEHDHRRKRKRGQGEVRAIAVAHPPDRGARNPLDHPRRRRSLAISVRRAGPGTSADDRYQPIRRQIGDRSRQARKSHASASSRCAWPARAARPWSRGRPQQIADMMEEWFTAGAADGFNIMPPYLPGGLNDFVKHIVPELQRRGLFRTEYEGTTLRENLGLRRPQSRYQAA